MFRTCLGAAGGRAACLARVSLLQRASTRPRAMSGPTPFNSTFGALPTTIFELMSQLAMQHGSINLGQGFPDKELEGPASMKEAAYRYDAGAY